MSSQRRIKEIFTLADLCAVDFIIDKKHYTCYGKVNTEKDDHHMISYIVDECCETWTIQLANGETKQMKCLNYDNDIGCYVYPEKPKLRITQYWPFQMLIRRSGESKYTLNHIAFDSNLKIVS